MRISAWSSDVCSSDLVQRLVIEPGFRTSLFPEIAFGAFIPQGEIDELFHLHVRDSTRLHDLPDAGRRVVRSDFVSGLHRYPTQGLDRKSVVEGKSVSVGVDLG